MRHRAETHTLRFLRTYCARSFLCASRTTIDLRCSVNSTRCTQVASAASVAGLIKLGVEPGATVVCVLTGHGLKDPDLAISQVRVPDTVDASLDAVQAALDL